MLQNRTTSEEGQALALLVLGFVAFLGFAALAIDGGMVYSDRRHAQNAADASSLGGAGAAGNTMESLGVYYDNFDCNDFSSSGTDLFQVHVAALSAASTRATSNDYTIDYDISDNHGVVAQCVDDENKGAYIDKYIDVNTHITRVTDTALIHFVYSGPVQEQVETVARVRPRTPLAFGHAVVALNDAPCSGNSLIGVRFSGNGNVDISGGGVYSNGCLVCSGVSFDVDVVDGNVNFADSSTCNVSHNVDPAPQQTSPIPASAFVVDEPDCSGLPDRGSHMGSGTIQPGVYSKIQATNVHDVLVMDPGLYCLTGSPLAFKVTGGELYGDGVTIFVESGSVQVSGNVEPVDLRAPGPTPDPSPAISGVLIYLAEGNTGDVQLTGNSNSYYEGTIYAPDGEVNVTGSSGTFPTFNTQIVAWNVDVGGSATIDINFNGSENYATPPKLDLQE